MSTPPPEIDDGALTVRPSAPADRPAVERLIAVGVLPGHVDYESREADRIRASLGSARDRFLVAEAAEGGPVVGTIAVVEGAPDVGHVHWLRVDPAWQGGLVVARRLVRAAAAHAREVGLLKLAMHAPAGAVERLAPYYQGLGFAFSRAREVGGVHVLEFYLNLYERPRDEGA
jgi:N-acetylglutamate synthase-like GNAT family acetyltransferase